MTEEPFAERVAQEREYTPRVGRTLLVGLAIVIGGYALWNLLVTTDPHAYNRRCQKRLSKFPRLPIKKHVVRGYSDYFSQ